MRSLAWLISLLVLTVGLIVLLFATPPGQVLGMEVGPRCWVGLTAHDVALEVRGWQAQGECRRILHRLPGTYARDPSEAPVICRQELRGLRYTVRDRGLTNLFGRILCGALPSTAW